MENVYYVFRCMRVHGRSFAPLNHRQTNQNEKMYEQSTGIHFNLRFYNFRIQSQSVVSIHLLVLMEIHNVRHKL